jgi:hypothetical protein
MWDDAAVGFKHFSAWKKCAVLTDARWIREAVQFAQHLRFLIPCEVRFFSIREREDAKRWIAA